MIELLHGDCLEKMQDIADGSVDAIITDPPYGTTACKWDSVIPFEPMWEQLNRIIKPDGVIVLFGNEPFSSLLRVSNIKTYKYDWVWQKSHATGHLNSKKQPMREHENIMVFYKSQTTYNPQFRAKKYIDRRTKSGNAKTNSYGDFKQVKRGLPTDLGYPKTIQYFATPFKGGEAGKHPTQKPTTLMEYLIRTYTNENETVLDFTMGSGSTGVACVNTNRQFIGIEKDDNYFKIACKRIEDTQKQLKLFI